MIEESSFEAGNIWIAINWYSYSYIGASNQQPVSNYVSCEKVWSFILVENED